MGGNSWTQDPQSFMNLFILSFLKTVKNQTGHFGLSSPPSRTLELHLLLNMIHPSSAESPEGPIHETPLSVFFRTGWKVEHNTDVTGRTDTVNTATSESKARTASWVITDSIHTSSLSDYKLVDIIILTFGLASPQDHPVSPLWIWPPFSTSAATRCTTKLSTKPCWPIRKQYLLITH